MAKDTHIENHAAIIYALVICHNRGPPLCNLTISLRSNGNAYQFSLSPSDDSYQPLNRLEKNNPALTLAVSVFVYRNQRFINSHNIFFLLEITASNKALFNY